MCFICILRHYLHLTYDDRWSLRIQLGKHVFERAVIDELRNIQSAAG